MPVVWANALAGAQPRGDGAVGRTCSGSPRWGGIESKYTCQPARHSHFSILSLLSKHNTCVLSSLLVCMLHFQVNNLLRDM